MRGAFLRRVGEAALLVGFVVATCFVLIRLAPGDPFYGPLDSATWSAEQAAVQRTQFGYDRPIPEQFLRYVWRLAQGDLGWSHARGQPVAEALATALPATALLITSALTLAFLLGIALGAWQGWRRESRLARLTDLASLTVLSIPEFLLALLLLIGPATAWGWFPTGGLRDPYLPANAGVLLDRLRHLALPTLALALPIMAVVMRLQAGATTAVRDAEFIRAARARGLPDRAVLRVHALRNSLIPALTYAGVQLSTALGGAVIVEGIFSWPGMGRLVVEGVGRRDYPLVAGAVLIAAICTVLGTLLADLALLWADPRRRRPS